MLLCPWDFPGKNTGVGCHALLQGIFLIEGLNLYLLHLLGWQADVPPGKPVIKYSSYYLWYLYCLLDTFLVSNNEFFSFGESTKIGEETAVRCMHLLGRPLLNRWGASNSWFCFLTAWETGGPRSRWRAGLVSPEAFLLALLAALGSLCPHTSFVHVPASPYRDTSPVGLGLRPDDCILNYFCKCSVSKHYDTLAWGFNLWMVEGWHTSVHNTRGGWMMGLKF